MKRIIPCAIAIALLLNAGPARAGNTKSFWTEAPSASLTTAVNVVNHGASTITVTAAFYDAHGTTLGNATESLAPNARWNFATNNTGNSTLAALLQSNVTGSIWVKSGTATQDFGAYATVYVTSSISGFNFSLASGTDSVGGEVGDTYTLNPQAGGTDTSTASTTEETTTSTITTSVATGSSVGYAAPDFTLDDSLSASVTLSTALSGKSGAVLYFAMWCPTCNSHLDHLTGSVMPNYPNVAFIVVDYVSGSVSACRSSQVSNGWGNASFTVVADNNQSVLSSYSATMGRTVVMNGSGVITMSEDYKTGTRLITALDAL